ncbi:MAG: hypothetical protein C0407_19010 [Desulfobacca sp.]|nr:hypothetical protein [Desulfobacca sp.]
MLQGYHGPCFSLLREGWFLVNWDKKDVSRLKVKGSLTLTIVNPAEFIVVIPGFFKRNLGLEI